MFHVSKHPVAHTGCFTCHLRYCPLHLVIVHINDAVFSGVTYNIDSEVAYM